MYGVVVLTGLLRRVRSINVTDIVAAATTPEMVAAAKDLTTTTETTAQKWWMAHGEEDDGNTMATSDREKKERLLGGFDAELAYENHSLLRSSMGSSDFAAQETSIDASATSVSAYDFILGFDIQPWCTASDHLVLDQAINQLLLKIGFGDDGDASFLEGVCLDPNRPLTVDYIPPDDDANSGGGGKPFGYIWVRAGGCKFCRFDISDKAMVLTAKGAAKETVKDLITTAIQTELIPNHSACLGDNPDFDVIVREVEPTSINSNCEVSVPLLDTLGETSTTSISMFPSIEGTTCSVCKTFDFETKANGRDFTKGNKVKKREYWDDSTIGVKIFTKHVHPTSKRKKARIFDTNEPGSTVSGGYPELGSPNQLCGGLGLGFGGEPGSPGENCKSMGSEYCCCIVFFLLLVLNFCLQIINYSDPPRSPLPTFHMCFFQMS